MHNAARFAILAVLILTGCSWYPYSPYYGGYNSYPSYVPPGGYQAPGPTYVPQNGPVLNQPTSPSLSPSSPSFSPSPTPLNSPAPVWREPATPNNFNNNNLNNNNNNNLNNNNAPLFNTNPPNTPVPLPRDPDPFNGAPPAAAMVRPPALASRSPYVVTASPIQPAGLKTDDPFLEPARLEADADAQPVPTEGTTYDYDAEGYRWLKGMVSFDDQSKTWDIIYTLTPDRSDKFGGSFELAPSEHLRSMQPGDLVKLHGHPDPQLRDSRGLPLYHVGKAVVIGRPTGQ